MNLSSQLTEAAAWFQELQARLCATFEALEQNATFDQTAWDRSDGGNKAEGGGGDKSNGGGVMRMLRHGAVIEKGGVHFSDVFGKMPPALASAMNERGNKRERKEGQEFRACGVSVIIHSSQPARAERAHEFAPHYDDR